MPVPYLVELVEPNYALAASSHKYTRLLCPFVVLIRIAIKDLLQGGLIHRTQDLYAFTVDNATDIHVCTPVAVAEDFVDHHNPACALKLCIGQTVRCG